MIRSRLRLKALGLCAMVLGLMAFSASAAQAEAGANWMVKGANVTSTLLPNVQITEIENNSAILHTKIAGALVEYLCTSAKLTGANLELEGKLTNGGKVKFTGCVTILNGSLSPACVPKSAGLGNGEIESLAGKGLMELHEGKPVTKIEPSTGENFAVIKHGGECSLPESVPVKGKLVIADGKGEGDKELVTHLIVEHKLSHLFVISDTAEHLAVIKGSANAALTGAHVEMAWSGLPG
jgi:hypothetical protein